MRCRRKPCCNHHPERRLHSGTCFRSNTRDYVSLEADISAPVPIHLRVFHAKDTKSVSPRRAELSTQTWRHAVVGKGRSGQSPHVVHQVLVAAFRVVSADRRLEGRSRRNGEGRIVVNVNQGTSTTVSRYVPWACVVALIFELSAVSVRRIAVHKISAVASTYLSRVVRGIERTTHWLANSRPAYL
jgi:hypothetical protein